MSRQKHSRSRARPEAANPSVRRSVGRWLMGGVGVVVVSLALYLATRPPVGEPPDGPPSTPPVPSDATPVAVAESHPQFRKLLGRWLRPDGGYVLEFKHVEDSGKLDAAYLNPRPIFVSRAEVTQEAGTMRVFVELQDVGYPGSNYTLAYDATSDQLLGVYYQAALRESFDIVFVRMK